MDIPKIKRVAHIVLYVSNVEISAKWYCEVLGMQVSARVTEGPYKGGVFMTFGENDHDIALFPTQDTSPRGREFEHVGLEVDCADDLDQLRRLYGKLMQHKVRIAEIMDHGVSTGIYFYDPDGHQLEVFCQRIPQGPKAIQELSDNNAQANPTPFEPLYS